VNSIAGSTRLLGHGLFFPGVGNLDYMQFQINTYKPDSWKGYNINRAAKLDSDPNSEMQRWRLDDEPAYLTYELITKNKDMLKSRPGFFNICVHKGLTADPTPDPKIGHPSDIPKAAGDWPKLNFIVYHSCIHPRFFDYPALPEAAKRKILGLNSAGLYGLPGAAEASPHGVYKPVPENFADLIPTSLKRLMEFPGVAVEDNFSKARREYLAMGGERSNTR